MNMTKALAWLTATLKAHAAGISAAASLLIADLQSGHALSANDVYGIVGAYLGVAAVTYVVPNRTENGTVVTPAPVAVAPAAVSQDDGDVAPPAA